MPMLAGMGLLSTCAIALAQMPDAMLPEGKVTKVSEHCYAIVGFPNIGIVVGNTGTLVIDTGLGERNGAIVVREVKKLAKGPALYLTTTHFHAEHVAGEQAFPAGTIIVRNAAQQQELDQQGAAALDRFATLSPQYKELLVGVKLRKPDRVYDKETTLDLGGVTARLFWLGAAHTQGDELIWVAEDKTLFTGDIVFDKRVISMPNTDGTLKRWLDILDKLEPLNPSFIVPNHAQLGDGSLIAKQRAFILDMQRRARALKKEGVPVEEAAQTLTLQFKTRNPDWDSLNGIGNIVRRVYAEYY
jgi:glyoxylase-like metal-dependent hydrolase (beta-lactamase superfamily II)